MIVAGKEVRKKMCKTCPMRNGGYENLREIVERNVLSGHSHLCHAPQLENKKPFEVCRGGQDYANQIMFRLRLITEPTDKGWEEMQGQINF